MKPAATTPDTYKATAPAPRSVRAYITTSFPWFKGDASGHFVEAEAQAFARAEPQTEVWVLAPGSPKRNADIRHEPLKVRWLSDDSVIAGSSFGWPGAAARLRENPMRAIGAARFISAVGCELQKLQPTHIVAHWALPSAWPSRLPTKATLEIVSHGADVRTLLALPLGLRSQILARLCVRAVRWRFVSQDLLQSLATSVPYALGAQLVAKAEVAPALVTLPDVTCQARELRRSNPAFFVSAGRLVPSKRVEIALIYAKAMNTPLVVLGDGPERARLQSQACTHGIDVRFLGMRPRDETLAWIAAADALLMASQVEGCSTVVREAHAYGTPVRYLN